MEFKKEDDETKEFQSMQEVSSINITVCENAVKENDLPHIKVQIKAYENKLIMFKEGVKDALAYNVDYLHPRSLPASSIFENVGEKLVSSVMRGFNTSCVVIGMQKSGKTRLLLGDESNCGLVEHTVNKLFTELFNQRHKHQFNVRLKYWEMTRDRIVDVLEDISDLEFVNTQNRFAANHSDKEFHQVSSNDLREQQKKKANFTNLYDYNIYSSKHIRNSKVKSMHNNRAECNHAVCRNEFNMLYVSSLRELQLDNYDEFQRLLQVVKVIRLRHSQLTGVRWHGFLQFTVETTDTAVGEHCVVRTLTFVHTKGSDRVGAKGVEGTELFEQAQINVSNTLLYAASIHSLEYRNKHLHKLFDEHALHDIIVKSQSFFMSCQFTNIMAQFISGCEKCFVIGCVDPLKYDETIDTMEKLQLLRQVTCVSIPLITLSRKGKLLQKLRRLEQSFGGSEVLAMVYSDRTNRPRTEQEEELFQMKREIDKIDEAMRITTLHYAHATLDSSKTQSITQATKPVCFSSHSSLPSSSSSSSAIATANLSAERLLHKMAPTTKAENCNREIAHDDDNNTKKKNKNVMIDNGEVSKNRTYTNNIQQMSSINKTKHITGAAVEDKKESQTTLYKTHTLESQNRAANMHTNTTFTTHGSRKKIYLNASKNATYEGEWCDGLFDGFGEHIQSNFKYRGEFKRGVREGDGTLFVRSSTSEPYVRVYQGTWLNGLRHGSGTEWCENGEIYKGEFENDERHGHGKLYCTNGDVMEGEFVHGKCHGWAILHCSNGNWYEGNWENGLREGAGTWHYVQQQRILRGEWSRNIPRLGTMEDDVSKIDVDNGKFIPRVFVQEYQRLLAKERDKLSEWRKRHIEQN